MHLILAWVVLLVGGTLATGLVPVSKSGLAGVNGFTFYDPYCAHGCFRCFSPYTLPCSDSVSPGGHTTSGSSAHTLALCRASSFPFLSSVAWCISQYCPGNVRASEIETFWESEITGDIDVLPQWSYGQVMANITTPPTVVIDNSSMVLNTTMLTTRETWEVTWTTLYYFFRETALESYYGLALCLAAFAMPLIAAALQYVPWVGGMVDRVRPWLWTRITGPHHDQWIAYSFGRLPTVGQGAYIAIIAFLNIVFVTTGYKTLYPEHEMQWYTNHYQELMAYWMWRTGVLAFSQMPVLFLFATRNNILLWLTNWSHSTFLLLHRWVAWFFLIQTLLHSILALVLYVNTGSYSETLVKGWWIWGCVATVAAVIIPLTSFYIIRQRAYELFLVAHVIMSVILVVGCWYHVWIGYENTFGYETWLYVTVAVWFSDRLVRMARMVKTGACRASIVDVGSTFVRIDVPGIRWAAPGRSAYVYFPTLTPLRPWENHPFSVVPTAILTRTAPPSVYSMSEAKDVENNGATVGSQNSVDKDNLKFTNSGLTLFVRKSAGMTRLFKDQKGVLTLLDGPYPSNAHRKVLQSDRLILIGGGIGITGLLSFIDQHPNVKLFYSLKAADECLLDSLRPVLDRVREKEIVVGQRLDISTLLRREAEFGWHKIAVVVCGPVGMCDDVTAVISRLGKEKAGCISFELEIEEFSW